MTTKRKIFFLIPFAIIVCQLVYTWAIFIFTEYIPHITNYLGLILFVPVLYFLYKDKTFKKALLATGIYLLLVIFCIANIFTYTATGQWGIGIAGLMIPMPHMNGAAILIFILYSILNFGSLVDMYLDYKESKGKL
jgi:hypothetical protein